MCPLREESEITPCSDLWVADSLCSVGCNGMNTFNPSQSSTFTNLSTPFSITYGSGKAEGVLAKDVVQLAGFSVPDQVFGMSPSPIERNDPKVTPPVAICDAFTSGLLDSPVSGLMGLAWQSIAASGAEPFWQTLASSGVWDEPLMAFQITRFTNISQVRTLEPGGTFTMGAVNSSLYTGSIDYVNLPSDAVNYWTLPLACKCMPTTYLVRFVC